MDGGQVQDSHFRATAAQCKAEGAANAPPWAGGGLIGMGVAVGSSASKEADLVAGCMARNGYIARQ